MLIITVFIGNKGVNHVTTNTSEL